MIANCTDETNFPEKLLLTDRQGPRLRNIFANNSSANIKLCQLSKMVQLGGFAPFGLLFLSNPEKVATKNREK